jgi:uncharacterized protein YciI
MKKIIILFALISIFPLFSYSQEEFEMKTGDTTYIMKKYFFCLLKRGPNRNIDSLKLEEIQKGHLAHLNKLGKEGKIAFAGPFDGDFDFRGIIIFTVKSQDEAVLLESQDPAIKAGRLTMEIYPWWAAKGSKLP